MRRIGRRSGATPWAGAAVLGLLGIAAPSHPAVAEEMRLTLPQAVGLAVRNSRALKDARLARDADRYDLFLADGTFLPKLDLGAGWSRAEGELSNPGSDPTRDREDDASFLAALRLELPTGGSVSFAWDEARSDQRSLEPPGPSFDDRARGASVELRQPLLRGGGTAAAMAPLRRARIDDLLSELDFRGRMMRVITDAVRAYRRLVRADRGVEIAERSLAQARDLLSVNQALIEAGRMASVDLIQTETQVANAEVDLLVAENGRDSALLALLDVLDLPSDSVIAAVDAIEIRPLELDLEALYQTALEHRPDFRATELRLDSARLTWIEAKNNRLWDLDFTASYGDFRDLPSSAVDESIEKSWSAGLVLGRTFGDRTRERRFAQSEIAVERAEVRLDEAREALRIELVDRLKAIDTARRSVEVAARARSLSERQLEIEEEKLRVGRSTNFEYLRLESDLVGARLRELNATIAYLDALTLLDEAVGTTLATWGVTLGEEAAP